MGLLVYDKQFDTFIFRCTLSEKDIAKSNGFRWHDTYRFWHQPNPWRARRLEKFATESALEKWQSLIGIKKLTHPILCTPKHIDLFKHQKEDIPWLIERQNAYYAGKPGVGKTLASITAVNSLVKNKIFTTEATVLIICPPHLTEVWKEEIENGATGSKTIESADHRDHLFAFDSRWTIVPDSLIHIHGIIEQLLSKKRDVLIVDEAHRYTNPKSLRSSALLGTKRKNKSLEANPGLISTAKVRWFLSGTPMNNRPIEMWPILNACAAHSLQGISFIEFAMRYCAAKQTEYGWDFRGESNMDDLRNKLVPEFMLIRDKICLGLQEKVIRFRPIKPPKHSVNLIKSVSQIKDEIIQDAIDGKVSSLVGKLAETRKELAIAKAKASMPYIQGVLENEEDKVIIFAWHTRALQILKEQCEKKFGKDAVVFSDGSTPKKIKNENRKRFQTDKKTKIFIGQIVAAGTGITLTASSRVIFVELSWVPGENEQAMDRAHRIGQTETVLVDMLAFPHDLDKKVFAALERKQKVINRFLTKGKTHADF